MEKHRAPKRRIAKILRDQGFEVEILPPQNGGCDLLVQGRTRVSLRVSSPRLRVHAVTARGRRYAYRYRSWHFNFHQHGKLDHRYADVFVCIGLAPRGGDAAIFVIPWEALGGKTFSLLAGDHRYAGRYAEFRDRWDLMAARPQGVAADPELRAVA